MLSTDPELGYTLKYIEDSRLPYELSKYYNDRVW
jgi:hypothetical protein